MSPKASRSAGAPGDEPTEPDLPPGYVRASGPRRGPEPVSWWWKSTGLVVLLAAAAVGIWLVVKGPDARESVHGTVDLVAEALTDADMPAFDSYVCDGGKLGKTDSLAQMGATSVRGVSTSSRLDVAAATLSPGKRPDIDLTLVLKRKDKQWCVDDMAVCPHYLDAPSAQNLPDVNGCRDRPRR